MSRGQFESYIDNTNILDPSADRAFIMINGERTEESPDATRTSQDRNLPMITGADKTQTNSRYLSVSP
jgi:hypothetical protein